MGKIPAAFLPPFPWALDGTWKVDMDSHMGM